MQSFLQTWLLDDYMFSNTYPLFMKLMVTKTKGEALSEAVNHAFIEAGIGADEFFELDSRSASRRFARSRRICYKQLCEEIKHVFQNGNRLILEQSADKMLCLYEISYNGYCYAYVVDHHSDKKVAILTDYYKPWEREKEDLLMTSVYGKPFVESNKAVNYRHYRNYLMINTYNVFCGYADYLGSERNLKFNDVLFHAVACELDKVQLGTQDENTADKNIQFSYVVYKNVIIIYQHKEKVLNENVAKA